MVLRGLFFSLYVNVCERCVCMCASLSLSLCLIFPTVSVSLYVWYLKKKTKKGWSLQRHSCACLLLSEYSGWCGRAAASPWRLQQQATGSRWQDEGSRWAGWPSDCWRTPWCWPVSVLSVCGIMGPPHCLFVSCIMHACILVFSCSH